MLRPTKNSRMTGGLLGGFHHLAVCAPGGRRGLKIVEDDNMLPWQTKPFTILRTSAVCRLRLGTSASRIRIVEPQSLLLLAFAKRFALKGQSGLFLR